MSSALVEVPVGYRAGGWEVTTRIASGSWASVYAARRVQAPRAPGDPAQDLSGALKFLPSGTLSPPQYADLREAVSEEVRFNEQADHPRLIRTFETFVVDDPGAPALHGTVVLAMERAAGSLHDLLAAGTPPDPVEAARLIGEICEALVHVHASGWVHGDLKPANVLLMGDRSVRLADFGLARELDGTHAYSPRLGSSDYLPPEWWSERIGQQGIATRTTADVWALGVTAHQLLTGGLFPFPGATARARAAAAQAYAEGRAPLRLADELPPAWHPIVADCLAADHAARRPHSAAALLERIEGLVAGGEPAAARAPAPNGPSVGRDVALGKPSAARDVAPGGPPAGRDVAPGGPPAARAATPGAPRRRPRRRLVAAGLAAVAAVTGGAFAVAKDEPAAPGVAVQIYNAEVRCQRSTLADCRLGLVGDPYAAYERANVVAHAHHGDRLVAQCYVPDGTRVRAENRTSSTRWYRVRAAASTAWLPAVRVWPGRTPAVGRCAA